MTAFRKHYQIDLAKEHAQCEANFFSLCRLLGDAELSKTVSFDVALPNKSVHYAITFAVLERSAHTARVHLSVDQYLSKWLHDMDIEVSMYFDAGMAEIVKFNGQRRLQMHLSAEQKARFGEDEKRQINQFLSEWLSHCIKYGLAAENSDDINAKTYVTNE